MDACQILRPATLRHKATARLQRVVQAAEEPRMIEHSVKRGGAEHGVSLLAEGQRRCVRDEKLNPVPVRLQVLASDAHHVRRLIDADNAALSAAARAHAS